MTIYPAGIDSILQLPTVAGSSSEAIAINALQSAVIAIETELGVNPRGIYSDTETRLSIIEARLGPGPAITGGPIDIDDAILSGTLSILKGGTGLNSIGVANTLMISNGVSLFYDFITNDNIDAAAAIDGSKIVPDFGAQDIITTGDIYITSVIFGASGPSITMGTGVPSSSQPNGSLYLRTDGTASTGVYTRQSGTWSVLGSGTAALAGGADTQVQFNDGGIVNGDAGFVYNKTTDILTVGNAFQLGTSGPTVTKGTGAPSASEVNGSVYLRTDGTSGTGIYTRQAGAWSAVGAGTPAGNTNEVQINNAGVFGGATNVKAGSGFISIGAVPSNSGAIRLSADEYIYSRDGNPGASNVRMLGLNSSTSEVEISTNGYDIRLFPGNARSIYYQSSEHQFYGGNGTTDLLYFDDGQVATSGINEWSTNQDAKGTERSRAPTNTQTTDATPASVGSFTLPANSTAVVVSWLVGWIKDDGSQAGGYSVAAVFVQDSGGTVSLVGTPVVTTIGESLAGADVDAITDGINIMLELTGVAATNLRWSWIRTGLEIVP